MQQLPQCWDLQCIVGRIQPIRLETMCNARAWPHNVGRALQIAPILLRYASVITEQTVGICWFKRLTGFKLSATIPNNTQQHAKKKKATGCTYGRDVLHPTMLGVVGQQCCTTLHRALHIVSWYCRLRALEKQAINSLCHSGGLPNISVVSLLGVFCQNSEV